MSSMAGRLWKLFAVAVLMTLVSSISGSLYEVFDQCCHEGIKWSSDSYRCDNFPAPVANVSDADQAVCLSIIEVCCIKQTQLHACEDGKQTALDSQLCAIRDTDPGAEQFRECCHCCRLGVVTREAMPYCPSPGLGEPCDSKYRECCLGQATGNLSFSGGISKRNLNPNSGTDTNTLSAKDNVKNTDKRDVDDELESKSTSNPDDGADNATSDAATEVQGLDDDDNNDNEADVDGNFRIEDVDECSLFLGQACSHICVNTRTGFYCSCPAGYELDSSDNRTCLTVEEVGVIEEEEKAAEEEEEEEVVEVETRPQEEHQHQQQQRQQHHDLLICPEENPCQQRCVVLANSEMECRCHHGYRLDEDGRTCLDIDECAEGQATCAPGQRCFNTPGRFTCMTSRCPQGYELNTLTGQCEVDRQNCGLGFAFNAVTGKCEDLNECGLGTDSCGLGERCENTIGSYKCRRIRHCGTGYTLDDRSQRCLDNDECRLGTHNCGPGYRCQNTFGSFRCVPKPCEPGFRFDRVRADCVKIECPLGHRANTAGNCVDINECEQRRNMCRRHQRCVNTRGSYYCRNFVNCPPGYEPTDNSGCQDVDECEKGTHKCGPGQQCVNRQGTYFCQCERGMTHDSSGRCVDVDECSYGAAICPSNSKCVNTIGSFICECADGLMPDASDSCTDVDECQTEGICQQRCINVLGTFFCSCQRGYQLRDDKRSCEDIDECTQFGGRRGRGGVCGGQCVNLPGSYRCECPDGWRLKPDGRSCQDVNECEERSAYCPHAESLCINTRGGYKCPVVRCPQGFVKTNSTGQNSIRCKRIATNCPECRRGLISRTYNFLSFASKVSVPAPLFSMTGSRLVDKFYTWSLDLISARPLRAGVEAANDRYFSLEKSLDFARVTMVKRIVGPQDVVLKLTMNVTSYYKGFEGVAESRIYLYVTENNPN